MYNIGPFHYYVDSKKLKKIFTSESIEIHQGEIVLITGDSGSGKSTLLKMLKGLIPEHSRNKIVGNFLFQKNELSGEHFKKNLKKILFLFQNPFSQVIHQNVPEEFYFSMENMMFTKEEMLDQREKLNAKFELSRIWNYKTKELSNGECQKLVLASMLAINPEVLLFDEPTAFLDPKARKEFYDWLTSIKSSKTIIIVDHHIDEILPIVDKIIKVNAGEITLIRNKVDFLNLKTTTDKNFSKIFSNINQSKSKKIILSNLSFSYKNHLPLLDKINCEFGDNEVIAINGENGRGKSTLFKLLSGLLKPTNGSIDLYLDNKKLSNKDVHKSIGYVFQNPEMHFFYDTIDDELKGLIKTNEQRELVEKLLTGINLKQSPFLLSEGEKRRLSILLLVLMNKSIYLYDEPTFGQDNNSIQKIIEIIKSLQNINTLQIIISHDEAFINQVANRVFEVKNNSLIEIKKFKHE